ncbi:MAG: DUF4007 family protein [Lachnospiraceae bacterium]|nr:DUF4007 family protein [Lachnospiraceae bacterium]
MAGTAQFEFHETFQPELTYIAKILELAMQDFSGTKYEISDVSGIPTGKQKGKVIPHIKYAEYMGLIQYQYENQIYFLSASPVGKEIFMQDKYLHENLTKWLCHYGISRKEYGAPQWIFVIHNMHPGLYDVVSQEYMNSKFKSAFDVQLSDQDLNRKVFGVVKRSYIEGCFESLHYMDWQEQVAFKSFNENFEMTYVYAYVLLDLWDKLLSNKHEITFTELTEYAGFGKIFGFSDDIVNDILATLEDEGVISVNRQLLPITIIRTAQTDEIIPQLYSQLL